MKHVTKLHAYVTFSAHQMYLFIAMTADLDCFVIDCLSCESVIGIKGLKTHFFTSVSIFWTEI